MESSQVSMNVFRLTLLPVETDFMETEAKDNDVTVEELFDLILGLFFITGYKVTFGKE